MEKGVPIGTVFYLIMWSNLGVLTLIGGGLLLLLLYFIVWSSVQRFSQTQLPNSAPLLAVMGLEQLQPQDSLWLYLNLYGISGSPISLYILELGSYYL